MTGIIRACLFPYFERPFLFPGMRSSVPEGIYLAADLRLNDAPSVSELDPHSGPSLALFTLREEEPGDEEFLYRVFASTRTDEMAMTGWPPQQQESFLRMQVAAQRHSYNTSYPDAQRAIILHQAEPAGRVLIDRTPSEVHIVDIALLPEYRGRGIGSAVMKMLLQEAAGDKQSVRLFVERFNPALHWYEALKFKKLSESEIYLEMVWRQEAADRS